MQMGDRGRKETLSGFGIGDTAGDQEPRQSEGVAGIDGLERAHLEQGTFAQRRGQQLNLGGISGSQAPRHG
jgi:hypothetical protein